MVNEIPTKEWYANKLVKEKLERLSKFLHFKFSLEWIAPTCLKCDGILSKAQGSSNLICLKCGAEYELKEEVK